MANSNQITMCGVDVSKDSLDIAVTDQNSLSISNNRREIGRWLKELSVGSRIALESTGAYHEELLDLAVAAGFEVYVLSGRQLRHYREAVGPRAKNDRHDARLLRRYLVREYDQLSPVKPLNQNEKLLWSLIKRRAMLVKMRMQLRMAIKTEPELKSVTQSVLEELKTAIRQLEQRMAEILEDLGWHEESRHCQSIPGIGPVNATALVTCFHRGRFTGADRFIAYLGLDVRVRDSGRLQGRRKLTKRGEPEMRRLLYNAAMSAARHPAYRPWVEQLLARGLSNTAVNVALSRKLARIAFALITKGEDFMLRA